MGGIRIERTDATEVITLGRLDVLSAITHDHAAKAVEPLQRIASDRSCRAVVPTGIVRSSS
jgi:enoyl-CoA hydratase/carnithine racemase